MVSSAFMQFLVADFQHQFLSILMMYLPLCSQIGYGMRPTSAISFNDLLGSNCVPCAAGYFSSASNSMTSCLPCAINTTSLAMSASCTPCPNNSITITTGSSICVPLPCTIGTFRNSAGACSNCLTDGVASCDSAGIPTSW